LKNPKKITTDKENLIIDWGNDNNVKISFRHLRKNCPCASCMTEREHQSKDYIRIYNQDQIMLNKIEKVGNYALKLTWNDGHATGIYEYSFLKRLSNL